MKVKTVLITGSTGGIGSAVARRLAQSGWRVLAGARSLAAGEGLARPLSSVTALELDICDEASIARACDTVAAEVGERGLDALVNLAGLSADGPLELVPLPALRRQFEVNVIGQIAVIQAFLPLLRRAAGRVINVGGAAGRMTLPLYGALSASKAALDSLTSALRMELKHQGVQVSYIEPGAVKTGFFAKAAEAAQRNGYRGSVESQRLYAPAIAAAARALAASRAEPVTSTVEVIVKALTVARPAARYVVGRDARLGLILLPRLPTGLRDRLLMSSLGLSWSTFNPRG